MRVAMVQFGALAEATKRLAAGGGETYYAQRYSVEFINNLASQVEELTVVHLSHDDPEERLPSGARSVGLALYPPGQRPRSLALLGILRRLRPDHLVLMSPLRFVLSWALLNGVRVLPMFADSFNDPRLKARLGSTALAALLSSRRIPWVCNHNLAASLELARIGVPPDKVLPFDWPALITPAERPAKAPPAGRELRAIFVGQLLESKGLGDLIDAVAQTGAEGTRPWRLTIAGGTSEEFARRAAALGVSDRVDFVGRVAHSRIVPLMAEHDAVVVPSRHDYPEGLPMTIYEGLCSRTPVVVSDHPMFRLKVSDGENVLVFRAAEPAALAGALARLGADPELYRRLSIGGAASAGDFFCPLKYDEVISRWLHDSADDRRELASYSLASGRYDALLDRRGVRVPTAASFAPLRALLRGAPGV